MSEQTKVAHLSAARALESRESYKDESWWRWRAIIDGGGVNKNETPATCIAKAAYGELFGWSPIVSVNQINLIDGKPTMAGQLMLGHIRQKVPQMKLEKLEHTNKVCRLACRREPSDPPWEVEFTIEEAQTAGLLYKDNWKKYPKAMLWWRAVAMLARELFSDLLMGVSHITEELEDLPQATARQVGPRDADPFEPVEEVQEGEVVEEPGSEPEPTGEPDDTTPITTRAVPADYGEDFERAWTAYVDACKGAGRWPEFDTIAEQCIGRTFGFGLTDEQVDELKQELHIAADLVRDEAGPAQTELPTEGEAS